jgi:signal transduction histidine kinase
MNAPTHCGVQTDERSHCASLQTFGKKTLPLMRYSVWCAAANESHEPLEAQNWGVKTKLGHNDLDCEARGSVSIDDWLFRTVAGAQMAPATRPADPIGLVHAAARKARGPLTLVVAGSAALVLPLVLHLAAITAPTLRAAVETMLTLFALGAAWLLRAQFMESRTLSDLLLLSASLALGLLTLCVGALPDALDLSSTGYLAAAELWGQLSVAGIFVAAAVVRCDSMVSRRAHPVRVTTLLGLAAVGTAGFGGLLFTVLGVDSRTRAAIPGPNILLVLAATGLLVYAAGMFARRNIREADGIPALLAVAAVLMAGATLSHLAVLPANRIGPGEALRVFAFTLILAAAAMLERRVRARLATTAALAERRRVARDLHDGIAQDLAFIAAHGAQIAQHMGVEHPLVVAAQRALAISRSTISDLCDPAGATAAEALDAVAQELRDRFDVAIAVNAQVDDHLASGVREQLSRITREAIANAARHGRARNVLVSLWRAEGGITLRIIDDGCGIPVGDHGAAREGFGLRSIRERASALGGSLNVRPAPEGGTELEVIVP